MPQSKKIKEEKLTKEQKTKLLLVIDGRIMLLECEVEQMKRLLLTDLKATKNWIKTL